MKFSRSSLKHPIYDRIRSVVGIQSSDYDTEDIRRLDSDESLWDYAPYIPSIPMRKVHFQMFDFFRDYEADLWTLAGIGGASYGHNANYVEGAFGTVYLTSPGGGEYATAIGDNYFQVRDGEDVWYEAKARITGDNTNFKSFIGISNVDSDDGITWTPPDGRLYEPGARDNAVGVDFGSGAFEQFTVNGRSQNDELGMDNSVALGNKDTATWFTVGFHVKHEFDYDTGAGYYVSFFIDGALVGTTAIKFRTIDPSRVYDYNIFVLTMSIASFGLEETKIELDWIRLMKDDPYDDP